HARELARLAPLDSERRRVDDGCEHRVVAAREAVRAALLEPLHLLDRQAGAARGLLARQLAAQPRCGERRVLALELQWLDELHLHVGSSRPASKRPGRSSAKSTSPGDPRSSQGTRTASRARAPSSGTSSHTARESTTG